MIVRSALTLVVLLAVTAPRSMAQSPSPRVFVAVTVFDADTNQPLSGLLGVGGLPFDITVVR